MNVADEVLRAAVSLNAVAAKAYGPDLADCETHPASPTESRRDSNRQKFDDGEQDAIEYLLDTEHGAAILRAALNRDAWRTVEVPFWEHELARVIDAAREAYLKARR